jgi:hypothetical protein
VEARLADALKWRDAIDEALGRCNDWKKPIQDDEKPEDALGRLIRFEVALNLDPETSEHVADLVAQTKRDALEEAARRLEELHKNHNYDPDSGTLTKKLGRYDKWPESAKTAKLEHDIGYYRALVEGAAAIRALEGEGDE